MDDEFSLRPIGFRIHPPDQTIAPKFRKNEIAIFSFVSPNINLHSVIKIKEPLQSLALERAEFGLEGLVAKRLNSVYESGRRSGAWVKIKLTKAQEFVIGSYTLPEGNRKYFGSLFVGYQGPGGLLFAARVGTGFSKTLGKHRRTNAKNQVRYVSICQPTGEIKKADGV